MLMRYLAVTTRKVNRGTNLMEVTITAIIVGVLAAFTGPSIMGILYGNQVNEGLNQLQNALQEAQQQAMRRGRSCSIVLDKSTTPPSLSVDTNDDRGCLVNTDRKFPNKVAIDFAGSGNRRTFSFSFKGTTTTSRTIIVKAKDGKGKQKCLAISNGLGIMRTGIYDGSTCVASN